MVHAPQQHLSDHANNPAAHADSGPSTHSRFNADATIRAMALSKAGTAMLSNKNGLQSSHCDASDKTAALMHAYVSHKPCSPAVAGACMSAISCACSLPAASAITSQATNPAFAVQLYEGSAGWMM